jgi:uncharacterized protein YhaN
MARLARKRPCRFCRRWFRPDPRLKERQRACSSTECQEKRQAANQQSWLEQHPGYFRGRAAAHREWRSLHPDAQRRWRLAHPDAVLRDRMARKERHRRALTSRAVEQEARALQLVITQEDAGRLLPAGEQESMRAQLSIVLGLATRLPPAAEQESIAGALTHWHSRGQRLLSSTHAQAP